MRLLFLLAGLGLALTNPGRAEDITLADGTVYPDATILRHDAATATILYRDGGAAVPLASLSPELQKRLDYDPAAARKQLAVDAASAAQARALAARTQALETSALHVWGEIVQVRPDGVVVDLETVDRCAPSVPVIETTAVHQLPNEREPDVLRTTIVGYRSSKISLGQVFVETDTTGLVDRAHWRGVVWPVGTYGYVTDDSRHRTIPAYTVSSDRAFQALATTLPSAPSVR